MDATTVLFVDTNKTFLRIAARLLREYYHAELSLVGVAASYEEALAQAPTLNPRIILVGIGQHSLEGLQVLPRMRRHLPSAGIIVLGALDIALYRQAALSAGADAFVAKVALNHELLPTIWHITSDQPRQPTHKLQPSGSLIFRRMSGGLMD